MANPTYRTLFAAVVAGCGADASDAGDAHGASDGSGDGTGISDDRSTSTNPPGPTADGQTAASSSGAADSDTGDLPPVVGGECDALEALAAALQNDPPDGAALIDAFFAQVAYGTNGFPIVDGDRLCFAYRDSVGAPLSVVGDFNAWAVGQHALDFAAPTYDLRYAVVVSPEKGAHGLYKFVREQGSPEYFADPWARRFGWDEFGEFSRIDVDDSVSHLERWPNFDQGTGPLLPRDVVVYIPVGGLAAHDLPVLYMHDGQNLMSPSAPFGGWRVGMAMDSAIEQGASAPALVVAIDNTPDRLDEYTHVQDDVGGGLVGGRADAYADFIVEGIKPFIDTRYPTALDAPRTAVAGSSLGGLVSLYIGWRHPDVFGTAASLSGTVGWGSLGAGNPTIADAFASDPPSGLRIYLDSGGGPGAGCPAGSADNYCDNASFADALRSLGWQDDVDLLYGWEPGAMHNEAAWAERFPTLVEVWFPADL